MSPFVCRHSRVKDLVVLFRQVKNCTVHINDDSVFEPEEEFQVHLGTPLGDHWSGAMVGVSDIVTITITNDEDGKWVAHSGAANCGYTSA